MRRAIECIDALLFYIHVCVKLYNVGTPLLSLSSSEIGSADFPKVKLSLKTKTESGVVSWLVGAEPWPLLTLSYPSLPPSYPFSSFSPPPFLPSPPSPTQEFDTSGSHDLEKSRTTGQLKTKLKFPDYGKYTYGRGSQNELTTVCMKSVIASSTLVSLKSVCFLYCWVVCGGLALCRRL